MTVACRFNSEFNLGSDGLNIGYNLDPFACCSSERREDFSDDISSARHADVLQKQSNVF